MARHREILLFLLRVGDSGVSVSMGVRQRVLLQPPLLAADEWLLRAREEEDEDDRGGTDLISSQGPDDHEERGKGFSSSVFTRAPVVYRLARSRQQPLGSRRHARAHTHPDGQAEAHAHSGTLALSSLLSELQAEQPPEPHLPSSAEGLPTMAAP